MMKQTWGLDRNVLRPTPGDHWVVEQHHWNTGAKENQQLNKIQKLSSFKSNENIHKREDGSYYVVSANKASSVTL